MSVQRKERSPPTRANNPPLMNQQMGFLFEGDVFEQSSVLVRGSLCLGNESLNFLFLAVVSGAVRDMVGFTGF